MRFPRGVVWGIVAAAGVFRQCGAAANRSTVWTDWMASLNTTMFDPREHDPRAFEAARDGEDAVERRRLEENSCANADGICCSLCKQGLPFCSILAGYLVEDTYYPSEPAITGSCDNIAQRAGELDVFGDTKTFRDTVECRKMVQDYTCLWWASTSSQYRNRCDDRGKVRVRPCRTYCTQIAIQCANSLEYMELCTNILCPPIEELCTPGPSEAGNSACNIYRYQTPQADGALRRAAAARRAAATVLLSAAATLGGLMWA
ncbi:hypothetical protein M885DRAFT_549221 [Pelagophyceae sp. CCMP2097]|nr:hypothetical protein M885DRAFT_549221 [Pelagophyceae sp. CCMP2097]